MKKLFLHLSAFVAAALVMDALTVFTFAHSGSGLNGQARLIADLFFGFAWVIFYTAMCYPETAGE